MAIKLAGRNSNIVKMEFNFHDFANLVHLEEQPDDLIHTGTIKAHGHLWKLIIYPEEIIVDEYTYIAIGLVYAGENTNTDPVVAKACIRTTTTNREIPKYEFSKVKNVYCCHNFATRKDIIENDCNDAGTFIVTVEIQLATEKRSVWFPQSRYSSDEIVMQLYNSTDASDIITFIIGTSRMEFVGHKCILFLRARELYELVVTEEGGSSSLSSSSDNNVIVLTDVDEKLFEILWKFIYTGKLPAVVATVAASYEGRARNSNSRNIQNTSSRTTTASNSNVRTVNLGGGVGEVAVHGSEETQRAIEDGTAVIVKCMSCDNWMQVAEAAELMFCPICQVVCPVEKKVTATTADMGAPAQNDENEETVKSILLAANRFGVTELKLYIESILVEQFLVPSKAAGLLLFADSYTCPLLKEESMNEFMTDSTTFMNSEDDWKKVQESPKLLTELLLYTNNGRKQYTPIIDGKSSNDDDDTLDDIVDGFDITSLRERLQKVNLNVDGSRKFLVQRWKDYVRANDNKEAGNW